MNTEELIQKVTQWGIDRNICGETGEGTVGTQLLKAREEIQEGIDAVFAGDKHELMDAIGDTTVCLILAAERIGVTFNECLALAYNEIKDRKGRMINGTFVKNV